jgi:hypothetical protein
LVVATATATTPTAYNGGPQMRDSHTVSTTSTGGNADHNNNNNDTDWIHVTCRTCSDFGPITKDRYCRISDGPMVPRRRRLRNKIP